VGSIVFPRLRPGPEAVAGGSPSRFPACQPRGAPGDGSKAAPAGQSATLQRQQLQTGLAALGRASASDASEPPDETTSVEAASAFERLAMDDTASALRLRNALSTATSREMGAIRACLGDRTLAVSTFFEVSWTVRPSGDRFAASDGRFERIRRGAVLPAEVIDCLAGIPFGPQSFSVPGLRLPSTFDSRVTVTFLLTAPGP
jgi:hypothetical protein